MVALYKELQPVDSYKVQLSHPISDYDRQLLTLFYQPLIGSSAMSLFMTLWADAEQENEREYTHYHLMNLLSMSLDPIFEARISLEAIGLLRTYMKNDGDTRSFIYKLYSPLGAKEFFNDPLLSTFLFSKIGEQAYRNLRARFALSSSDDENFKEVSRTFLDVYKPVTNGMNIDEGSEIVERNQSEGVPFVNYDFDFNLLKSGLSEQMVPQAALASVSRETISKLAFLYSLSPLDMQKVIMMALDEDLEIPDARLRRAAADYYKMSISKEAPVLQKVYIKEQPETNNPENLSREEALLYYLENTAPVDMLRDLNDKEPLSVDVQLAERLINTHDLPIGVVNVLLQYVHIRNDGKITNNYVERIASHWMNKKVSTAKEALEFSRKEHDKYMQWKNEGQKPAANNRRGSGREAMVPEWFFKKDEKKEHPKKMDPDVEERRLRLLEKLNARRTEVK
ncbi:replication initiation and membrane attachment family protein [Sporosarcina jiandibaonis]|uniref:replication initiation and membrane attachment family protein n=1 Tax=Sporosarcina jiandibaonis TaxID=2715535 RepID=UPI0015573E0F|nr:DnaD domain protein [Sporosarcina jiandibaonis]